MQNRGTQSRFKLFASRLKGRATLSIPTTSPSSRDNQASHAMNNDSKNRRQVEKRYKKAIDELRQAINLCKGSWGSLDFEELSNEAEGVDYSQFKNMINSALLSRETSVNDSEEWSKIVCAVECVFMTPGSLSDNFLLTTQGAQPVIIFLPA